MHFFILAAVAATIPMGAAIALENDCFGKGLTWVPDLVGSNSSLQNAFASMCRQFRGEYTVPALYISHPCETVYGGKGWVNSLEVEISISSQVNSTGSDPYNFVYFSMDDCMDMFNSLTDICADAALVFPQGVTVGSSFDGGDPLNITGWLVSAPGDCFQAHAGARP